MKQSKTLIYWLSTLLAVSFLLFVLFIGCKGESAVFTVIFRTLFTGSVVGLITAGISYYIAKKRVLQDFSNDLLMTHTELYNIKSTLNRISEVIGSRGLFFDTQELSIWLQTILSIASVTHNTFVLPYKYSPFFAKWYKSDRLRKYMSDYIKADRNLWNDIDKVKYQMMTAKISIEENQKIGRMSELSTPEEREQLDRRVYRNDRRISGLIKLLENASQSGDLLKNLSFSINVWMDANKIVSPINEMEESEKKEYDTLVKKEKRNFAGDKKEWKKQKREDKKKMKNERKANKNKAQ